MVGPGPTPPRVDPEGPAERPAEGGAAEIEPTGELLSGIAADANELARAIAEGRGGDVDSLVAGVVDRRRAA